ncbi:FxLYD domain-containing protein [Candidatus Halobonum tyrrellensis]|uniref:CARDB domain-containing protein n=1 Tax=Candidatus Halobonum tyrrellensis G22 TaxID=1324957 RepID=V4GQV6_9EURY|nr:FxLYD domain-containing protein [Candidatus Halobonum tyrrellensis]ESP87431.1 hypothetical protein K933_14188 [Candidatus Halobonum tyrrellensis G22]
MFRRKFLKAASGPAVVGLTAGCMGGEESQATEQATPDETDAAGGDTATAEDTATDTEATETTSEGDEETTTSEGDVPDIEGQVAEDSPENLEVSNRELYRTDGGAVGLRGTVENTGEETYRYVEAEVTLQDDEGDALYEFIDEQEEESTVTLDAGSSWQFDVVFEEADDMSAVTAYTVALEGVLASELTPGEVDGIYGDADEVDPNLEITSHELTREESTTYVTATVENAGGENIQSVEVTVTLYDADDGELDVFDNTVEESEDVEALAPGESWDVQVEFEDIDMREIARYVVRADSTLV